MSNSYILISQRSSCIFFNPRLNIFNSIIQPAVFKTFFMNSNSNNHSNENFPVNSKMFKNCVENLMPLKHFTSSTNSSIKATTTVVAPISAFNTDVREPVLSDITYKQNTVDTNNNPKKPIDQKERNIFNPPSVNIGKNDYIDFLKNIDYKKMDYFVNTSADRLHYLNIFSTIFSLVENNENFLKTIASNESIKKSIDFIKKGTTLFGNKANSTEVEPEVFIISDSSVCSQFEKMTVSNINPEQPQPQQPPQSTQIAQLPSLPSLPRASTEGNYVNKANDSFDWSDDGYIDVDISDFEYTAKNNESSIQFYSPSFENYSNVNENSCNIVKSNVDKNYENVFSTFKKNFGLNKFRTNQLEAILAALNKKDCFILMPTGGGKSLCYQLTATIDFGVTIVVSPLKSLVLDQVQKLDQLQIPAEHLLGGQSTEKENYIYDDLKRERPAIKMLFVTPEKLSASLQLNQLLTQLYSKNLLARVVIDEAHCISQWGHDFRPDYKKLSALRQKYPRIPFMALTATATPRVQQDILNQLQMQQPEIFIQSFNRPNLQYLVLPKTKDYMDDIVKRINGQFAGQSGIIYCFSRMETEKTAERLTKAGIKCMAYHAGLSDADRNTRHNNWLNDRYKVMSATIAFGMGIDKPDVRFVFHATIPKSVEGYFQESGRAGRDGLYAQCIIYYTYGDSRKIKSMILKNKNDDNSGPTNPEVIDLHLTNLKQVVQFCENKIDCRRKQMLAYFGEKDFNEKIFCMSHVKTACDNCTTQTNHKTVDITKLVLNIVELVGSLVHDAPDLNHLRSMCNSNISNRYVNYKMFKAPYKDKAKWYTTMQLVDICRGLKTTKMGADNSVKLFGCAQEYSKNDVERVFKYLLNEDILDEFFVSSSFGAPLFYAFFGKHVKKVLESGYNCKFDIPIETRAHNTTTNGGATANNKADEPVRHDVKLKEIMDRVKESLKDERNKLATSLNITNPNIFFPIKTIHLISRELPVTASELIKIDGVTDSKIKSFGDVILACTKAAMEELKRHNIDFSLNKTKSVRKRASSSGLKKRK